MKRTFARVTFLLLILLLIENTVAWPFSDKDETAKPTRDRKKEKEERKRNKNKNPKSKYEDSR